MFKKRMILGIIGVPIAIVVLGILWVLWGGVSNPAGRKYIGEISSPGV